MFEVSAYYGMVNSVLLIIQAAECKTGGAIYAGHRRQGVTSRSDPGIAESALFQLFLQDCLHEQAHAKVSFTRQDVEQQAHYDHTHLSFTGRNACCVAYYYYLTPTEVSIARTS